MFLTYNSCFMFSRSVIIFFVNCFVFNDYFMGIKGLVLFVSIKVLGFSFENFFE